MSFVLARTLQPPHEADIRAVSVGKLASGGELVATGSRDGTVRAWVSKDGVLQVEREWATTGRVFLSTICVLNDGAVMAAGGEHVIYCWAVDGGDEPIQKLTGHSDVVCGLGITSGGDILSASYDKSVRRWRDGKCTSVLNGHEGCVWVVLGLPDGDIVTASADRTLILWDGVRNEPKHTFIGHKQAVRDVKVMQNGLLSSGNDGSFIWWSMSGEILRSLSVDTFVYSVAVHPSEKFLVAGTEDRGVLVIQDGDVQSLEHPSTVWAVSFLANGDVLSGCADGFGRLWTPKGSGREAQPGEIVFHQSQLAASQAALVGDLPALQTPGKSNGDHRIVSNRGKQEVYEWNGASQAWKKLGDVVSGGGQLIDGKEFDYRFDIQVGDGGPHLPLGVNRGENAYAAAQRFIDQHMLEQDYLQQIADFIVQNTETPTIGQGGPGRLEASKPKPALPPRGAEFQIERFFPRSRYFVFSEVGNAFGLKRLVDEAISDTSVYPSTDEKVSFVSWVDSIVAADGCLDKVHPASVQVLSFLDRLFDLPDKTRLVALDLLRIVLAHAPSHQRLSHALLGERFRDCRMSNLSSLFAENLRCAGDSNLTALCAARSLCNALALDSFQLPLLQNENDLVSGLQDALANENNPVRAAVASCLFNFALLDSEDPVWVTEVVRTRILQIVVGLLSASQVEQTVVLRVLVALHLLAFRDDRLARLAAAVHVDELIQPIYLEAERKARAQGRAAAYAAVAEVGASLHRMLSELLHHTERA